MTTPDEQAEAIYIAVYSQVSTNADFLEPRHGPDLLLSDTLIAALSATMLAPLISSFFGEFGRTAAEALRRRAFGRGEVIDAQPDELVAILKNGLEQAHVELSRESEALAQMEAALVQLGVAPNVARRMALSVLEAVRRELE